MCSAVLGRADGKYFQNYAGNTERGLHTSCLGIDCCANMLRYVGVGIIAFDSKTFVNVENMTRNIRAMAEF